MNLDFTQEPSKALYQAVLAGFRLQGTSLNQWCLKNQQSLETTKCALYGVYNGKKYQAIRKQVILAAQGKSMSSAEKTET